MASERHDGDRQDSAAGLRYLLKYSHRKCTLCGFVMKNDGEWPECPYDKGHMKPMKPKESGAKGGRGNKGTPNRSTFENSGSTRADVTVARLKRDRPDLAKRVEKGEMSANAAAIEDGFRKPPLTPFQTVMKLLPKLTTAERRKVKAELDKL